MGVIDIIILVIVAVSVIYGAYRGFLGSLLSGGCFILAVILAFIAGPRVSEALRSNQGVCDMLSTYTDAVIRVEDSSLSNADVELLDDSTIDRICEDSGLPGPISSIVSRCLKDRTYRSSGISTVKEYMSDTLVGITVNVLSYVACFLIACILLNILSSVLRHVAELPVLKQLDSLCGAVIGLLRAVLILYVIFLLVPVISTLSPVEGLEELLAQSKLAPYFTSSGLFTRVAAWLF